MIFFVFVLVFVLRQERIRLREIALQDLLAIYVRLFMVANRSMHRSNTGARSVVSRHADNSQLDVGSSSHEEIGRVVREVTRRAIADEAGDHGARDDLALAPLPVDAPLVGLARRAELTQLEIALLRVLHAAAVDRHVYRCFQRLAGDPTQPGVAVDALVTVLEAVGEDPVDVLLALDDQGVLATRGLVHVHGDARVPTLARRLTLPDRVVTYLVDGILPHTEVEPWLVREPRPELDALCPVPVAERPDVQLIDVLLRTVPELAGAPVWLVGRPGAGRKTMLAAAAAAHGYDVLTVAYRDIARLPIAQLIATLWREVLLMRAIVCIADVDVARDTPREGEPLPANGDDAIATLITRVRAAELPIAFTSDHAPVALAQPVPVYHAGPPAPDALLALWRARLPDTDGLEQIATRFHLTPGHVVRASDDARRGAADRGRAAVAHADIADAISGSVARQVELLGTRVRDPQGWGDIVLPAETLDAVRELIARVRHRHQVLDRWGFRAKLSKGLGLAALFSGPPGTGKTMVSNLIAKELGQDLYQIDLSRIVSKWIGETEKNLARVFDAAEGANVVLLFDEADAMFGKRTEVKSSNDRHANAEVNYLLQRVERFEGVCILTTNLEGSIDPAFKRRLAFRIQFPMPDARERLELWRRMVPPAAELTKDVDFADLARYELAGGNIRNALLRAAFLAASESQPIDHELLDRAVQLEYRDAGKLAATGSIY